MAVYAYESLTISSAASGLTAATVDYASSATITVEGAAVRLRMDGSDPTATEGHEAEPGDVILLESSDELQRARFIRRDGANATLRISYFI